MTDGRINPAAPPLQATYIVQIESDAKTLRQQRRNRCLGEMESVKKLFGRLFRKGRKARQESEQRPPAPPKDDIPRVADKPPQIQPIMPLSAVQSRETMGRSRAAHSRTSTGVGVSPIDGKRDAMSQALKSGREDDAVSAMTEDASRAPPSKSSDDGASEAISAAPMEAATAASAVTESEPDHITTTSQPESASVTKASAKENEPPKPNGTVAKDALSMWSRRTSMHASGDPPPASIAPSATVPAVPSAAVPAVPQAPKAPAPQAEDKIPVHSEQHELPPIQKTVAVPGMSATSGPLEDFPGGSYE